MRVSFHDPNEHIQWEGADYFTWGIHFSEAGYTKMAKEWFRVLKPLLLNMGDNSCSMKCQLTE